MKYLLYYKSEDADPDLESLPFNFSHVPSCVGILFDLPLSRIRARKALINHTLAGLTEGGWAAPLKGAISKTKKRRVMGCHEFISLYTVIFYSIAVPIRHHADEQKKPVYPPDTVLFPH